ncbi:hypothetical protein V9T20_12670 (plasmid) [Halobacterium salinarum]|uniref:hypothetical protein n=1 Tax=Halobacterium salinarum TaxID=2242 RepID=UPI0030D35EF5
MTDYKISDEPPRDDQGHPVHPERGHRICGATKSDRSTPAPHGRSRDDVEYCLQSAGWGCDRSVGPCKNHPVSGEQWGESNPNYTSGAFSEFEDFMYDSLTERERDAVDALNLDDDGGQFAAGVVKEAYMKYQRSGDDRFLREARQWAAEFGVIDVAPEQVELDVDRSLTPEEKAQLDELFDEDPQP